MPSGPRFPLLLTAAIILLLIPIAREWNAHDWREMSFGGGAIVLLIASIITSRLPRRPEPTQAERGSITILLVEDSTLILEFVLSALTEGIPAEVKPAKTKAEAERLLANGRFDAALVDLGLPDGSGMDLIHRIRGGVYPRTPRAIPIVVFSGIASLQPEEVLQVSGANDFLVKPFLPRDAVMTVQRLMRESTN